MAAAGQGPRLDASRWRCSRTARPARLGVQPPSLYKYFDSLMGLYDALFRRGLPTRLQAMRAARDQAAPGLGASRAGLEASGRWCLANGPIAQVMFWRPVPASNRPSLGDRALHTTATEN